MEAELLTIKRKYQINHKNDNKSTLGPNIIDFLHSFLRIIACRGGELRGLLYFLSHLQCYHPIIIKLMIWPGLEGSILCVSCEGKALVFPLTLIFENCLRQGDFPEKWKKSKCSSSSQKEWTELKRTLSTNFPSSDIWQNLWKAYIRHALPAPWIY